MTSNEEIYISSLCDRIMAFCNRLNKRLDVIDEREQPGYQHYSHHQPLTAEYGQPPYASFDSMDWQLPRQQPRQPDYMDWQQLPTQQSWELRPPDPGLPYGAPQLPPTPYHQQGDQDWQPSMHPNTHPSNSRHSPPEYPPPPSSWPSSSWYPQGLHLTQPPQPTSYLNSCWDPPGVHLTQPPYQHHTYGQEHHQLHQYEQPLQSADAYWQQHHQYHEPMLDQQPPPQHFPSYWHPPSPRSATTPSAAISPPCSPDIRYSSLELLRDDIEESEQSRQLNYDDIVFDRLLIRDQHVEEDVLLNSEEVLHVANEIQLDPDFPDVIAQVKEAINSSVEDSFTLIIVEASMELIAKEVDRGFGRNGSDKMWKYADTIGNQSKVSENIAVETNFVTDKTNNYEDVPSDVINPKGGDVAIISRRSTALDPDGWFIPPRDDRQCLGIHGHVDKLPVLSLNYSKPKDSSLVNFGGDNEWRCSIIWCVFDPGGDTSPRFSLSPLFVASCFPP